MKCGTESPRSFCELLLVQERSEKIFTYRRDKMLELFPPKSAAVASEVSLSQVVLTRRLRSHDGSPQFAFEIERATGESKRQYVFYWMTANRRLHFNFSLDRAIEWSLKLKKPLLIFEGLRCDYQWASRRLHTFVIQGMVDQAAVAQAHGHCYVPYVERSYGEGSGLIRTLLEKSSVAVTDDFPCFFLPRMTSAVARRSPVLMESVDSNGMLPMRAASDVFPSAYAFRRFLQRSLAPHLSEQPKADPLANAAIPRGLSRPDIFRDRWSPASELMLACENSELHRLPIDHSVREAAMKGGEKAAIARMSNFLNLYLRRYGEERNEPDEDVASGLSPYLHFGHISVHQIFSAIVERERWTSSKLGDVKKTRGSREGWWGVSASTESFLDELVTWRELGYNYCWQRPDYDQYDTLPDWLRKLSPNMSLIIVPGCILSRNWNRQRLTIRCGTRRRRNWSQKARCTITFACCGARKSLSGLERLAKRCM